MADVLDDLMAMAEVDPQEILYIRENLPNELKDKFDDEQLQYMVDVIFEYLDEKAEEDEIVVDDVAQYVVAKAKKEQMGNFDAEEVSYVVDTDLDYLEQAE